MLPTAAPTRTGDADRAAPDSPAATRPFWTPPALDTTTAQDRTILRTATAEGAARWATSEVPEVRRTPGAPERPPALFADTRHSHTH